MSPDHEQRARGQPHRYLWPRFVLAGVILALVLAALWMSREIQRIRRQREWTSPAPAGMTNGNSRP